MRGKIRSTVEIKRFMLPNANIKCWNSPSFGFWEDFYVLGHCATMRSGKTEEIVFCVRLCYFSCKRMTHPCQLPCVSRPPCRRISTFRVPRLWHESSLGSEIWVKATFDKTMRNFESHHTFPLASSFLNPCHVLNWCYFFSLDPRNKKALYVWSWSLA